MHQSPNSAECVVDQRMEYVFLHLLLVIAVVILVVESQTDGRTQIQERNYEDGDMIYR